MVIRYPRSRHSLLYSAESLSVGSSPCIVIIASAAGLNKISMSKKAALRREATALANVVLPAPAGPRKKTSLFIALGSLISESK
ncbi:hypothetical protein D3C81_1761090 [compost metagenome]